MGGHDHTSSVHAVALDYPTNTNSWNRKGHDHTSSVHAVAPSLRGKKQSPESMIGNSDGRYAPMGNTSSVIDGEPSHALRALLLRRWRAVFPSLSAFASDWPAVLSHPALLYPHSPIRTGNRSTGCGITFQSHCHSPCAGLSPAIPMMGNRDAHQKGGSSADIPHRNLAPLAHGHKPRLPRPTCQAGIEDQRGTEAQKTPCGATPNKSAGAANDLNSFVGSWHRDAHGMVIQG